MTTFKMIFLLSSLSLFSCKQNLPRHKVDPLAETLAKRAMALPLLFDNPDSSKKAVSLLDSATQIDSDYYWAHYNKLLLLSNLKQFDKALVAVNNLIRLRPTRHDFYLNRGYLYHRLDDSNASKADYQRSLTICTKVLDTMSATNPGYDYFSLDKAISLIMLDDQEKGNQLLKEIYARQTDKDWKEYYGSYLNKTKDEILKMLDSPTQENSESQY